MQDEVNVLSRGRLFPKLLSKTLLLFSIVQFPKSQFENETGDSSPRSRLFSKERTVESLRGPNSSSIDHGWLENSRPRPNTLTLGIICTLHVRVHTLHQDLI
jgi:hypothetical protein